MAKKKVSVEVVTLKFKDPVKFIGFINKFRVVDNNVLVVLTDEEIIVRSYNDSKTVVKTGSINIKDVFDVKDELPENLQIGFYNLDKLSKFFNVLSGKNDLEFQIGYTDNDDVCYANYVVVKNNEFEKTIRSIDRSNFRTMGDKEVSTAFKIVDYSAKMKFDKIFYSRINALSNLEDSENVEFKSIEDNIFVLGKEFKLKYVGELELSGDVTTRIDKKNLAILDGSDYDVYLFPNKTIFMTDLTESEKISIAIASPKVKVETVDEDDDVEDADVSTDDLDDIFEDD